MRRSLFIAVLAFCGMSVGIAHAQSSSPSLRIKAYQRVTISGVAPSAEIKVGGKETPVKITPTKPVYYIYLIANKVPYIKLERVWINQELYTATINRVPSKPVLLVNGKQTDTLVRYTDEAVWQISIKDKDNTGIKPKKDIADKVAANELVLRLNDKNGTVYTRTVKSITKLEPAPGM